MIIKIISLIVVAVAAGVFVLDIGTP